MPYKLNTDLVIPLDIISNNIDSIRNMTTAFLSFALLMYIINSVYSIISGHSFLNNVIHDSNIALTQEELDKKRSSGRRR